MATHTTVMKKIFTYVFLLFTGMILFTSANAQSKIGKVSGIVKSPEGSGLEGATISLLKAKDSSLAKSALTNKAGEFEMEKIADGKFLIRISAVGYANYFSKSFDLGETHPSFTLPAVSLVVSQKNLGTVSVATTRPLIENKIDKTVVNVEASVTNVGSTALEVLEKSPGISVDRDGNISLKGKQGVIILMDGKPTYLSGSDLANLLRNMPANQLDQIEIMSQPSAKFDASGNSGVINIKTKRQKTAGFNGSISLGYTQGVYPKSNNSFAINSRKGKVNLFANYSYSYFKGFNEISINRKFRDKTTKVLTDEFDQNGSSIFEGQPHNLKLGADFFATKKTTFGIVLNGFYNERKGSGNSLATIYDGAHQVRSYNDASSSNSDPWKNYSLNLNFRHVFDSTGREITADLDLVGYITKSRQSSDNDSLSAEGVSSGNPYILQGYLPSEIKIYTGKIDYAQPIKGGARFEAGLKVSSVKTDNDAQYTTWDKPSNSWVVDNRSNHFLYDENINAAYVNFNKQMKKWGVQLGLRLENTQSKGKQLTNNQTFDRNYTQLFPTSYVSYKLNEKNNFGLSYGRRIDRPNYQDMNPFQYFLDRYTYREGNPYLTPQFSHNIELSHNFKGQLNTSLNYTRTTDVINDVLVQNDTTKITFQTKRNIATRRNIGLSISYNKPLTKWWTLSFFSNVFNNYFEGYINNAFLHTQYTSFMLNSSNQFKFKKGWSAEISGFYRSKTLETGLIVSQPMGMFSLGGSKQILKNKGTLRLNFRDPFYLQKFRGYTKFDNIDAVIRSQWDNRQLSLNFTYRFGKNTNNVPQRKRAGSSQDEQNRVGGNQ
jgi:hypothetical protein